MVKVEGIRKISDKLSKISKRVAPASYRKAIIVLMLATEANATPRTPVDTGNLRRSGSGNATVTESNQNGAKGVTAYTANYSVYVHEREDLRHTVGEAKFLSNAIKATSTRAKSLLGNVLRNVFVNV